MQLPKDFVIVFEPVTHARAIHRRQGRADPRAADALDGVQQGHKRRPAPWRCGLGRCGWRWKTAPTRRVLPALWIAGDPLHDLLGKRRPFLTAKRLLTNQTFRDIYRTDTLDVDQRLKITSLTFLFTDLKGSTELYERVGDLVAYDLVREHFTCSTRSWRRKRAPWSRPSATR